MRIPPSRIALSQRTATYIMNSKRAQSVFKFANNNPSLTTGLVAFTLATTIRPLTILMTPTKNKEDKKYAVAKSISSGLVDAVMSTIMFIPLSKFLNNSKGALNQESGLTYNQDNKLTEALVSFTNRLARICTSPIQSSILYTMLPKVLRTIFKKDDHNENRK